MYKISIDDIENEKDKTLHFVFSDELPELKAKVSAELDFISLGEFIQVKGDVSGSVKLLCDLCLKEFDYELNFTIDEMFAKNTLLEEYGQETELKNGQFVTDLDGDDEIDVYDLLYQSVILNLPNKKVCGINCNGDKFLKEENLSDPRLDVFKNIQIEPKNK
jgi:uncharacterized metal-binding protein YceD (DUF177 family)